MFPKTKAALESFLGSNLISVHLNQENNSKVLFFDNGSSVSINKTIDVINKDNIESVIILENNIVETKYTNMRLTYIDSNSLIFKDLSSITISNVTSINTHYSVLCNKVIKKFNNKIIIGVLPPVNNNIPGIVNELIDNKINVRYYPYTEYIGSTNYKDGSNYLNIANSFSNDIIIVDLINDIMLTDKSKANTDYEFASVLPNKRFNIFKNYKDLDLYEKLDNNIISIVNQKDTFFELIDVVKIINEVNKKYKLV